MEIAKPPSVGATGALIVAAAAMLIAAGIVVAALAAEHVARSGTLALPRSVTPLALGDVRLVVPRPRFAAHATTHGRPTLVAA
jgi:hypothetical protein